MGGLRERFLWDALRGLWVEFLRVGVWEVLMWGQCGSLRGVTVGDTLLLTPLPMKAGEELRDLLLLVSCCPASVCGERANWPRLCVQARSPHVL